MSKIIITDSSLRDGNHAVKHKIDLDSIDRYSKFAEAAGIPILEVGHGNGLGASSLLIGQSPFPDEVMLATAKQNLSNTKLGIHIIPGITTIKKDVERILDVVDVYRVATHCSEATLANSHIEYLKNKDKFSLSKLNTIY